MTRNMFGSILGLLAMLSVSVAVQAQSNGKIVFKRGPGFWVMDADGSNPTRIESEFLDRGNNNNPSGRPTAPRSLSTVIRVLPPPV